MLQIAILSAAPSLDHGSLPSVSGFADNDLRLIGHTVFRDERDSHSPASESPEQPAKIAKAQLPMGLNSLLAFSLTRGCSR